MVGYCFGVPFCMSAGQAKAVEDGSGADAIVTAHGQISFPSDFEHLKAPALFVLADNDDFSFSEANRLKAEAMLRTRPDHDNFEFRLYAKARDRHITSLPPVGQTASASQLIPLTAPVPVGVLWCWCFCFLSSASTGSARAATRTLRW
jgi:hypothetical protein